MDHVQQPDDIRVRQLLHQRDLADGGGRRALLVIEADFLEGDNELRLAIFPLVDGGVGALLLMVGGDQFNGDDDWGNDLVLIANLPRPASPAGCSGPFLV